MGAELFHADRRMDRRDDRHDEANSHFSKFCERAQKLRQATDDNIMLRRGYDVHAG
jgi:hypothetical protein